jgi:hypothetical protein
MPAKLTGYQIYILSCGCKTRTLTPEPFSGTFNVKCSAHERFKTPADIKRMYLPDGTVYAECNVDFGGEIHEPEG